MTHSQDFLVEIGTEELPPKSLVNLATFFANGIESGFNAANLPFEEIQFFATPRRIAVLVKKAAKKQMERLTEKIGPNVDLAYDQEGKPTSAAIGFAKSCGITPDSLKTVETPKGKCLYYQTQVSGKSIFEVAPTVIRKALNQLPIPKPMLWGNHSTAFLRPVHSLVVMYGAEVIPFRYFDLDADNQSFGHRFHSPSTITIQCSSDYAATLEKNFVIADYQKRKTCILDQIQKLTLSKGSALVDDSLLEEVTSIVEWPNALMGSFDKRFLAVPQEALISSMKTHQKCFPLIDEEGNLLPYFITIANINSKDPQTVIVGNERVMRARLADAEFFYQTDLKQGIEKQLTQLKTVIFQHKLGTVYDKSLRIAKLAVTLAEKIEIDPQKAHRAGLLCKADLTSEMVGEFPELQGIMGYYYALEDNISHDVATAIKEHYLPRFSGDRIPTEKLASLIAIADKLDTLVGIFGINQAPTGEKDPFGLRRAALAINRILIERNLSFDLGELIELAVNNYPPLENPATVTETLSFMMERLRAGYVEKGMDTTIFNSVFSRYPTSPLDFNQRIQAVNFFQTLPEAKALSAANKRVSNILRQANFLSGRGLNPELFEHEAEKELATLIEQQTIKITEFCIKHQYQEALILLSTLKAPIDKFFDQVMVLTDDEKQRNNRLVLLHLLQNLFLQIADISLLH